MASTIKVDTITTPDGTGNISVDRPLSGSGAGLTSLPAANLTGALPAISGASLTGLSAGAWSVKSSGTLSSASSLEITGLTKTTRIIYTSVTSTDERIVLRTASSGTSWDTGASDYYYIGRDERSNNTLYTTYGYDSRLSIQSTGPADSVSLNIDIFNPQLSGKTNGYCTCSGFHPSGFAFTQYLGFTRNSAGVVVAVQLYPTSGTINGTYVVVELN